MKLNDYEFTLGADPEVFIRNKRTGKFICPDKMIPGTKREPVPLGKTGNTVQLDGFAAEIGIPPCGDEHQFEKQLAQALSDLDDLVGPEHEVVITSTAHFDKEVIDEAPAHCKIFGCDPDYNAHEDQLDEEGHPTGFPMANRAPSPDGVYFRTGGGHIHVGWTNGPVDPMNLSHLDACRMLAKAMDFMIGVPSLFLDPDTERRKLYGKAGAFRPKPYGMEWRSTSNWWLSRKDYRRWVFGQTVMSISLLWSKQSQILELGTKAQEMIDKNTDSMLALTAFESENRRKLNQGITNTLEITDV